MTLSFQFKESVKTALAMTIAYWIALSMDWDRPYWAGFAVAFISLATLGQSLNKGALRMAGTLMGMVVALTLIALFAQDRWLFMLFLSAWVGLCTYMMGGTKHLYFWHVSSFVCVIIAVDAGPNSIDAFNTALMFPVMFVPLLLTAYLPFDLRPDQAFLRLVGRYFRSGEYLLSSMRWDPGRSLTRLDGWRRAFHARELASLPKKLGAWARFVDTKSLPGTSPDQLQALVTSLQALTFRMQELLELRGSPQAQFLVQELLMDFRAWRLRVQGAFQRLSQDPTPVAGPDRWGGRQIARQVG